MRERQKVAVAGLTLTRPGGSSATRRRSVWGEQKSTVNRHWKAAVRGDSGMTSERRAGSVAATLWCWAHRRMKLGTTLGSRLRSDSDHPQLGLRGMLVSRKREEDDDPQRIRLRLRYTYQRERWWWRDCMGTVYKESTVCTVVSRVRLISCPSELAVPFLVLPRMITKA